MVTGLGLDSEWRAGLAITGTVSNPILVGTATMVRGGYEFAGRRFDLERGTIRFTGSNPPDPVLDIVAAANLQGLSAAVRVTGTGLRPDVSFTSVPGCRRTNCCRGCCSARPSPACRRPKRCNWRRRWRRCRMAATDSIRSMRAAGGGAGPGRGSSPPIRMTGAATSVAAGKYITRRLYVECHRRAGLFGRRGSNSR